MKVASVVALLVTLVSCGKSDSRSRADSSVKGPDSSVRAAPAPRADSVVAAPAPVSSHDSAAFRGGVDRVEVKGHASGVVILNAVRTARHNGYDRIVFEFRGSALPDYLVEYTHETPTQCGSGAPVSVRGAEHLFVRLSPVQAHAPVGNEERGTLASRTLTPRYPTVEALTLTCDFEAVVSWVVGLSARKPFRVTTLGAPARLILDVESR